MDTAHEHLDSESPVNMMDKVREKNRTRHQFHSFPLCSDLSTHELQLTKLILRGKWITTYIYFPQTQHSGTVSIFKRNYFQEKKETKTYHKTKLPMSESPNYFFKI